MTRRLCSGLLAGLLVLLLAACAGSAPNEPLRVSVAQFQPLQQQEGAQARYRLDLRVHNPSRWVLGLVGADVQLLLRGKAIGSGVVALDLSVPAFGEGALSIEVGVHDMVAVRQAIGLYGAADRPLPVLLTGHLTRPGLLALPWRSEGELRFARAGGG
ncbi:LEA type 2 family protein [Roseateles oligotrophus]|uniref:NDR1/HIN1-like protein n=1 Tax=Roseateles oligotrophus TaxID=1769250 RepID=UPI00161A2D22|nr:LEA type 2 family protein [Roseateles oligotrophus]